MAVPITVADFADLGIVAGQCNNSKLNIAIQEALDFDLCALFEDLGVQVKIMLTEVLTHSLPSHGGFVHAGPAGGPSAYWDKLIKGCLFTQNDKPVENLGIKRGVVYYAYSRYLMLSSFDDSASGFVTKENPFSIPKPLKEVEQFANKYRTMGRACFLSSISYICSESENFPELKDLDCQAHGCGCKKNDACGLKTKGFGFKGTIIEKQ